MSDTDVHAALRSRLLRRAKASGSVTLPAVPSMVDTYVDMCDDIFVGLGVEFSGRDLTQLREILLEQLRSAFTASPRSEVVITYESPVGRVVNYHVHTHTPDVGATYDSWTRTRQGPLFGSEPDAKVLAAAVAAGDPAACPVLDIGAGTGRNAITMARRGHPVDAVEMTSSFASALRDEAARASLPLRVIECDMFDAAEDLRDDYGLIVLSEVTSDFRSVAELDAAFALAAAHLAPQGRFVVNAFVTRDGYAPDDAVRELAQQCYSSMYTPDEIAHAASSAGLVIESDESVWEFEKAYLPSVAWPPTGWYEEWITGRDVFDLPVDEVPMELRWLVLRKQPA